GQVAKPQRDLRIFTRHRRALLSGSAAIWRARRLFDIAAGHSFGIPGIFAGHCRALVSKRRPQRYTRIMRMQLTDVPVGDNAPYEVNVVIEITQGSSNKIEYDPRIGAFVVDRTLFAAMYYPCNY